MDEDFEFRDGTTYRPSSLRRVAEPFIVEVRRNGVVEAVHRVHAVAVRNGAVVEEAGDAGLTCFMRSSSKPLQALPLVRAATTIRSAATPSGTKCFSPVSV